MITLFMALNLIGQSNSFAAVYCVCCAAGVAQCQGVVVVCKRGVSCADRVVDRMGYSATQKLRMLCNELLPPWRTDLG